jgi:hypothetical protein
MLNNIPIALLSTGLLFIVMGCAWLFVELRIKSLASTPQQAVVYLHRYFLNMALFSAFVIIPFFWLPLGDAAFSQAMAWGYVIGHIFTYIGLLYVARMVCISVPKLNRVERPLTYVWVAFIAVVTVINAKTMIWGVQPTYNHASNLIELHAAPVVAGAIAVSALFSLLPAVALFIYSAIKSDGAHRVKASLLALGFLLLFVGGPMHDAAQTANFYAMADIITILSTISVGAGVAFRIERRLAVVSPLRPVMAPSNSV